MFRLILPEIWTSSAAGVRNIKDEPEPGVIAGVVYERNTLGAAANISSHAVIPQGILCAGRCLRALGVDLYLLVEGILVKSGGCLQKSRPLFQTARYLPGGLRRQFCVLLNFAWHLAFTSWVFMICLRWV